MVMVTNGLNQGWSSVLLPVHARENLGGPTTQCLLVAVFGGCALAGALLYGAVGERFPRRAVFTAGFLVERVGPAATLLGIGAVYFLTTLAPLAFPVWR